MRTVADILSRIQRAFALLTLKSSEGYWIERYKSGGNSGLGSYGQLAQRKAHVLNGFVEANAIHTIIEYGCGDGNQLALAKYPRYIGFDVSPHAIARCKELFRNDPTKMFKLMSDYQGERADLTLSLDVIYHLVEDDVFENYMALLFSSSEEYVILYSTNVAGRSITMPHVKHRPFTSWINTNLPGWHMIDHIPGEEGLHDPAKEGRGADFFIYQRGSS